MFSRSVFSRHRAAPRRNCGAYLGAAFITFFVPNAALIRGRRLIGGGGYSSKYGTSTKNRACEHL